MIDTRRLQRLLQQIRTQSTVPQAEQVAASIARWFGYYRSLQIVLERYQEASSAYTAALPRVAEKFTRFVTLVDRYVDAMVQFLDVNVVHSILHQPNTPSESAST